MPLVQMSHALISLLHCLYIAFNGKEKCHYSAMQSFQNSCKLWILELVELYGDILLVLDVLYSYGMVSILPLHIPWVRWSPHLEWVVPSALGWMASLHLIHREPHVCPCAGGVSEEEGDLGGWWASFMAWGNRWPLCHENFTRMSLNSPTTSCEIGCGQSVFDEKCVCRNLFWLISWTVQCLYEEETCYTRCQRLNYT